MTTSDKAKQQAFIEAAHTLYLANTGKTFQELKNYNKSDWEDGLAGAELKTIEDAKTHGKAVAMRLLEKEDAATSHMLGAREYAFKAGAHYAKQLKSARIEDMTPYAASDDIPEFSCLDMRQRYGDVSSAMEREYKRGFNVELKAASK